MRIFTVVYRAMDGAKSFFYVSALSSVGAVYIVARMHHIPEAALEAFENV